MSLLAVEKILYERDTDNHAEFAVLFHMGDSGDNTGRYCHLNPIKIAWLFNLNLEQVHEAVGSLLYKGVIERMTHVNGSIYRIHFDRLPEKSSWESYAAMFEAVTA